MKKTSVIIAAAGSSSRMGGGMPKQYRMCENLPVLVRTVRVFCNLSGISEIICAVPPGDTDYVKELFSRWKVPESVTITQGGASRRETVEKAIGRISSDTDFVLIHDGARPFVTEEVISRVRDALFSGALAAVPAVTPKNTIRTKEKTLERKLLYEVQTPQGFDLRILKLALDKAGRQGFEGTDEASVTERMGISTVIVEGDYRNIKITTPEDLPRMTRTGIGYDVHRMVPGRPLMLGCVNVPYDRGLLGHSDADVIAHAVADALLGAAALGDIGKHFPDTSEDTLGMSGKELLSKTAEIIENAGFTIVSADATLVAERPKIAPYKEAMEKAVAKALGIENEAVSIKATTEEGLGISGGGDAMACYAVANLIR